MARVRQRKAQAPAAPPPELPADEGNLPGVLTVEAVKRGAMPPLGSSGLPTSLEGDVPEPFRYWKATDAARAREVRDALVESGLFVPSSIVKVGGEARRIVTKYFLAEEAETGRELARLTAPEVVATNALADSAKPPVIFGCSDLVDLAEGTTAVGAIAKARELAVDHPVLVTFNDLPEVRAELLEAKLSVFKIATRPGLIFATDLEIDPIGPHFSTLVERIEPAPSIDRAAELVKSAIDRARVVKADAEEERFVFGIVLEPDVVDSQADTYDANEVRKAAHGFMSDFGQIGLQHASIVTGKIKILESYLAPVDFELEGTTVKKGTWLLAVRVIDDELWAAIKAGDLTGFSIGGVAMRAPAETPPA